MSNLTIRRYQNTGSLQLKKLYEIASISSEVGYRKGPWEKDFEDIERHYFNGGDFLVGIVNNEIIAMGGLEKISDSIGHIRRMRVHPDHRRNGYARQIIKGLESSAKKNNLKELRLRTSTLQKMAQQFYEKNGYIKMDTEKEYYTEGPFEVIWYRKEL